LGDQKQSCQINSSKWRPEEDATVSDTKRAWCKKKKKRKEIKAARQEGKKPEPVYRTASKGRCAEQAEPPKPPRSRSYEVYNTLSEERRAQQLKHRAVNRRKCPRVSKLAEKRTGDVASNKKTWGPIRFKQTFPRKPERTYRKKIRGRSRRKKKAQNRAV